MPSLQSGHFGARGLHVSRPMSHAARSSVPGASGHARTAARLDCLSGVLLSEAASQEHAPHLDIVGDLTALLPREIDAEVSP